ncbi:MAG: LysR family transcriptional regulator [Chloroflexi bacterium]|nr:LysR family transcriptional regulator [Chloroflexota bacterium]MCL5076174.1 LysR family transcriptional regulator [Chloroflexota bacterium]
MEPRSKFWIEKDGELVLSDWRVELLEAIEETGSLSRAAERVGVAYRRAWGKIKEMEGRLGVKMIVAQSGGLGGGGTHLTPEAKDYIRRYRRFRAGLKNMVDKRFEEAFGR